MRLDTMLSVSHCFRIAAVIVFVQPNAAQEYRSFVSSGLSNFRMVVKVINNTQFKYICCLGKCAALFFVHATSPAVLLPCT